MERSISGKIARKQYQPQEPTITVCATPSEIIALGHVITQYLHQVERTLNKTKEQLEIIVLLRSFQGRVVYQTQNLPQQPPPNSREVQR